LKYGIIGTGAVGGYYGGMLARLGLDVHFLLHSDYQHVRNNGLIIDSKEGDFVLPEVNAYPHPEYMPLCDVVIIALKTTQNDQLKTILPRVVKKRGVVVVLQNGLGVEKDIAQIVTDAVIVGGLCFLCSNKIGPGHINHIDYGAITLGEYAPEYRPSGITKSLEFLSYDFSQAGINVQLSDNLGEARWKKLVWNIPFNGLSVVLSSTTNQLIGSLTARSLAKELMIEVIIGARKCGYSIEKEYANEILRHTEQMVDYKPSMKLDFEKGRPLETDTMYKNPIAEAESAGYIMKAVRALFMQLKYLEEKHCHI